MSRASAGATRIDYAAQVNPPSPPGPHKARDNPPIFVSRPCPNHIRSLSLSRHLRSLRIIMNPLLRKFWSLLALLAGLALIFFEWRRAGGITGDNIFWLFIAALIVILSTINL